MVQKKVSMQSKNRSKEVKEQATLTDSADLGDLLAELKKMNRLLKAQTSFAQSFLRGVLSGFGSVLGATIVVGFVLGFVAWILVVLVQVPILGDFVKDQTPVGVTVEQ